MNICKSGLISARTKSLREKFSRNRSYSELSFKESAPTTSSLISTPTESCSGSLSTVNVPNSSFDSSKRSASSHVGHSIGGGGGRNSDTQIATGTSDYFVNEPYCSALDLSAPGGFDEPRFPWQRDAAIQCDLISAPLIINRHSSQTPPSPLPPPQPQAKRSLSSLQQQALKKASSSSSSTGNNKKKTSSSSTSSTASTLINAAAAATLRMTRIGGSDPTSNSGGNRFWRSSLLLPSFNLSSPGSCSHEHSGKNELDVETCDGGGGGLLRRQKSSRWASASVRRPATLKRAASFDSRRGYARLVQSTSSPNSPPESTLNVENQAPLSALPILSSSEQHPHYQQQQQQQQQYHEEDLNYRYQKRDNDEHCQMTNLDSNRYGKSSGNFFFGNTSSHSIGSTFRSTALLGASAAMTAAAPFGSNLIQQQTINMRPSSSPSTATAAAAATASMITTTTTTTTMVDTRQRKLSSNEITLNDFRRKQFMNNRKQPSSAPDSFDEDSVFSEHPKTKIGVRSSTSTASNNSGDNHDLFNFNTVHRLLNISLSANNSDNVVKPFLLELPDDQTCHQNLPSPNVQSEIQEVNPVLRKLSVLSRAPHKALAARLSDSGSDKKSRSPYLDLDDDDLFIDDDDEDDLEPPSSSEFQPRRRRRALVPPKLITDGYESSNELFDIDGKNCSRPMDSKTQSLTDENDPMKMSDHSGKTMMDRGDDLEMLSKPPSLHTIHHHHQHLMPNVRIESIDPIDSSSSEMGGRPQKKSSAPASTSSSGSGSNHLGVGVTSTRGNRRRSSVVVIPPMQICPGDLLVYSKVLSQRSNMIDNFEGTLSSALLNESENRKHKNTWSLLRLCVQFDRSTSRNKADAILMGLEEVLHNLQPTNSFVDETMLRYRGISWSDFVAQQEERRISNASSSFASATSSLVTSASAAAAAAATASVGIMGSRFFHGARFSSLQSNALESVASSLGSGTIGSNPHTSAHMCKKISLPNAPSGLSRAMQLNMERIRSKNHEARNSFDSIVIEGERETNVKPKLQRAESYSTVSDVESINDNFEIDQRSLNKSVDIPGTETMIQQQQRQQSSQLEEQSGDQYLDENCCCTCVPTSKREQRRRETLWELFQSDLLFLTEHLMVLKNVFMEPLKKIQVEGFAMFAEPEVLFGNLDELCLVTYAFCREFLNTLVSQTTNNELQVVMILSKLFQNSGRAAALTQAYHRYTLNYINALNYLETLRRQIEFTEFEKWCNRDPRCKKLQLTDLLVAPVQHVMRVPLLLKEIESRTHDPNERTIISAIIQEQEHSLRELDDKMRWLKNFERLLEIQRNIMWPSVCDMDPKVYVPEFLKNLLAKQPCERLIVSPRRQIILEGPLMILDSGKAVEMYVFLFDDLLLITRRKKGLGKKQSTLTERFVSNCSGRNSSFSSVTSGGAGGTGNVGAGSVSAGPIAQSTSVNVAGAGAGSSVEPTHGSISGGAGAGSVVGGSLYKYVVYKQPLSLDRFYIHDILPTTEGAANLKNGFVLVCLNRFQQVVTLHTFQAMSETAKNTWLSKLRDTSDRWKRTLQNNVFRKTPPPPSSTTKDGQQQQQQQSQTPQPSTSTHRHGTPGRRSGSSMLHHTRSTRIATESGSNTANPQNPTNANQQQQQRLSTGSMSIASTIRDNASSTYNFDDTLLLTTNSSLTSS